MDAPGGSARCARRRALTLGAATPTVRSATRLARRDGNVLATPTGMDLLTWLIVGLVAGLLASALMRDSGYGLLGDIAVGIAGAIVGSWTFRELGWRAPLSGIAGVIVIAVVGAVIVLFALRVLRRLSTAPRR